MSRLVALILMLCMPAIAWAMPPVVAVVAMYAAQAVLVGELLVLAQIAIMAGTMAYGKRQARKQERRARAEFNAGLQDRSITQVATEAPHVYVYGRARVGSAVVAIFTSGAKDEYKHLVCVHAAHECDAIEEIYVAGKPLGTLTAEGYASPDSAYSYTERVIDHWVKYTNGEGDTHSRPVYTDVVRSRVRAFKHLGTPTDPVDSYLHGLLPSLWPSTAVLRGFCYTVITLDLNQAEFQGGIPSIEVLLRGKKLYDPRTGLTQWSQNNALVIRDYLTSELCGVDADDLPEGQLITAANVCDESTGIGARYTFNGTVTSDQDQSSVLEQMAQSMAGCIVSTTWDIYAGKYVAPVMALDQTDIVGQLAITPGVSDADLYNGVKGQYISDENSYVSTDIKPYQNSAYVAADGRELWTSIDFPFTDKIQRVHNLARIFTEDQRNGYTIKAEFSQKAWKLKVGNRVTLSSTLFGWDNKIFRVTDKQYSPRSFVELTLKEDSAEIWDFADAVTADSTPNTNLKNPFSVDAPASVTCSSGTDALLMMQDGTVVSRLCVEWPEVVADLVEIEYLQTRLESEEWEKAAQISADLLKAYISPVEDGEYYLVRIRSVNVYLNVKSPWLYSEVHQVVGKSEPPPDISAFSITNGVLSWTEISRDDVLDLAGYRIRFQYGRNTSWADAADMHTGLLTSAPFKPELIPPGALTIMIKAVDTSGNESINPAVIYHSFGDIIVENLILEYDDQAAGFSGTITNGAVIDGGLLADDSGDLFWGADNARFWGTDTSNFWPTATYKGMVYVLPYTVQPEESGSRLTLDFNIVASAYNIEYRYGTQGEFLGNDADYFWGADDALSWPQPTAWQTWPGEIQNVPEGLIEFRITTQAGIMRGALSALTLQFDVEDEYEEIDDVPIIALGTRLPITKTYRSIKNIQLTLQDDGGTAVSAKWNDKLATGPLVYCFDTSGTKTSGVIDARIQGVKG